MADSHSERPDRNLALELVRTTEAAALAAARWMGRGDKEGADGAAVDAMRIILGSVPMDGFVVIGEGEKDEAPMLYIGEVFCLPEDPFDLPLPLLDFSLVFVSRKDYSCFY